MVLYTHDTEKTIQNKRETPRNDRMALSYRSSMGRYIHYNNGGHSIMVGKKVCCKSCGVESGPNTQLFIGDEPWKRWLLRHLEQGIQLRGEIYAYCEECL